MIDESLAAFLQAGLAIHLGSRNARLEPHAAHVMAAIVEPGGTHVTVYLPAIGADDVLADLRDNGQVAVVFARPEDDRSCQVKGVVELVRDAADGERGEIERQYEGFRRQLDVVGLPGESTRSWVTWPCVALRLRVTALFSQTPGPDAGAPLT